MRTYPVSLPVCRLCRRCHGITRALQGNRTNNLVSRIRFRSYLCSYIHRFLDMFGYGVHGQQGSISRPLLEWNAYNVMTPPHSVMSTPNFGKFSHQAPQPPPSVAGPIIPEGSSTRPPSSTAGSTPSLRSASRRDQHFESTMKTPYSASQSLPDAETSTEGRARSPFKFEVPGPDAALLGHLRQSHSSQPSSSSGALFASSHGHTGYPASQSGYIPPAPQPQMSPDDVLVEMELLSRDIAGGKKMLAVASDNLDPSVTSVITSLRDSLRAKEERYLRLKRSCPQDGSKGRTSGESATFVQPCTTGETSQKVKFVQTFTAPLSWDETTMPSRGSTGDLTKERPSDWSSDAEELRTHAEVLEGHSKTMDDLGAKVAQLDAIVSSLRTVQSTEEGPVLYPVRSPSHIPGISDYSDSPYDSDEDMASTTTTAVSDPSRSTSPSTSVSTSGHPLAISSILSIGTRKLKARLVDDESSASSYPKTVRFDIPPASPPPTIEIDVEPPSRDSSPVPDYDSVG